MRRIFIIKTGSTEPSLKARRGDFEDWIRDGMGLEPGQVFVIDVAAGESLPHPGEAAAVITGSHDMVTERRDWSERTALWLREAVPSGVPILGICYGHQLLAHAMGGRVGYNPRGPEIGTAEIRLAEPASGDALLGGLPASVRVHESHSQSVLALPPGAVRLASNTWDENQAFRLGGRAWGVQFHPEFDEDIMRAYEKIDGTPCGEISVTPHGPVILRRFAAICRASGR